MLKMSEELPLGVEQCPFQVGDFIKMRSCALKLLKYLRLPKNDVGVVTGVSLSNSYRGGKRMWLVHVHWQQLSVSAVKEQKYFHIRLKHLARKSHAEKT